MNYLHPNNELKEGLWSLWQEAFEDSDDFLEHFWCTGFALERCLCAEEKGMVCAALYWFDCYCEDKKIAYLYAVATKKSHRGRGICRALMERTMETLKAQGYCGAILCPENDGLFTMYRKMGFCHTLTIREFSALPEDRPVFLRKLTADEYARLRREYLPAGGVVQEGKSLTFLEGFASFYAGEGFLLAARKEKDSLFAMELLGNTACAPGILAEMKARDGRFRSPGKEKPYALYAPVDDGPVPGYFGLAFD